MTPSTDEVHYEYAGMWVCFGLVHTDIPHVSCLMADSGEPDASTLLLSEAETAAVLSIYQYEDALWTMHHTKPILITTLFRNHTARITQARFDGKKDKLVLQQSRLLDLSGQEPSADAWTLLNRVACRPTGETRYPTGDAGDDIKAGPEHMEMAPWIVVADSRWSRPLTHKQRRALQADLS